VPATPTTSDPIAATEQWMLHHGLPYFVPTERAAAREALHPRRTVPLLVGVVVAAVTLAVLATRVFEDLSLAPAALTSIGVVAGLAYALTALRARPILTWAVRRTLGSLRQLLPMVTRALPLLLIFVTFLFINAEVWHVAANLDGGALWLTVLLFTVLGIVFFLVRLPEEIDRADDELDDDRIAAVCAGTPLAGEAIRLAADGQVALDERVEVNRFERANLTIALLIIQTSQVLLVALTLMAFFIVFGAIAMKREVVEAWIGGPTLHLPGLENVSVELLQVSVFLAAFSGLYFTVVAVTDETFRDQFFTDVMNEMERAIAVRAVYNVLLDERDARPVGGSGVEVLGDEGRDPR
jgi:hypothetical protein